MEPINDLDLLISEADRMSKTFRAFERLPRILEVIRSTQNLPDEVDREISQKQSELTRLENEIGSKSLKVENLNDAIKKSSADLKTLETKLGEKSMAILSKIDMEVEEAKIEADGKIKAIHEDLSKKIMEFEADIEKQKEEMERTITDLQTEISLLNNEEDVAKKRAKDALDMLAKIRESLPGGGD